MANLRPSGPKTLVQARGHGAPTVRCAGTPPHGCPKHRARRAFARRAPPPAVAADNQPGDWPHGCQLLASRALNAHLRETELLPHTRSPLAVWPACTGLACSCATQRSAEHGRQGVGPDRPVGGRRCACGTEEAKAPIACWKKNEATPQPMLSGRPEGHPENVSSDPAAHHFGEFRRCPTTGTPWGLRERPGTHNQRPCDRRAKLPGPHAKRDQSTN